MLQRRQKLIEKKKEKSQLKKLLLQQQQEIDNLSDWSDESRELRSVLKDPQKHMLLSKQKTGVKAHVAEWVSMHSQQGSVQVGQPRGDQITPESTIGMRHSTHAGVNIDSTAGGHSTRMAHKHAEANLVRLQRKVQMLVESKMNSRKTSSKPTSSTRMPTTETVGASTSQQCGGDIEFPWQGVAHLKKLQLLPDSAGGDHRPTENMDSAATAGNVNPLRFSSNFDYHNFQDHEEPIQCGCGSMKQKVKSGKFVKSNPNIIKPELWPHNMVSKKYAKRTTFEGLDFELFVAGESKIIYNMLSTDVVEAAGRLRVLMLLAHWMCRCRDWVPLRNLFKSIMEEVETGASNWADDFSSYETMLPQSPATMPAQVPTDKDKKKNVDVYWCKNYQHGQCELSSPHMAIIKSDEPPVPVLHICAACWALKKRREYPENDPTCPQKKGGL